MGDTKVGWLAVEPVGIRKWVNPSVEGLLLGREDHPIPVEPAQPEGVGLAWILGVSSNSVVPAFGARGHSLVLMNGGIDRTDGRVQKVDRWRCSH